MAYKIEIELTDLEARIWSMFVKDPQEWVEGLVRGEVYRTSETVYLEEIARLTADPEVETMPASRDAIIALSTRKSARELNEEIMAQLASGKPPTPTP